jgi:putative addiction module component (TIGR02574 family)
MSKAELETLRNAALALSESERAKLARDLVASLDGPQEDDVATAWDIEICRRINEIEAGRATLLDVDDVLTRVRARIAR